MPRAFSSFRRSGSMPVNALHERALAVIDMAGRADDEVPGHAALLAPPPARGLSRCALAASRPLLGCAALPPSASPCCVAARAGARPTARCRESRSGRDRSAAAPCRRESPAPAPCRRGDRPFRCSRRAACGCFRDTGSSRPPCSRCAPAPRRSASVELDEQPERRDSGDVPVELVADLVGHEPHLPPLQQLALRVVGPTLALGGVTRDLRQILVDLLAAGLVQLPVPMRTQQAMDDEIRIAPDGRREVRVARSRKPEVPEVLRRVSRLLHRLEHQERDGLFLGLALNLLDQLLEMPRLDQC